MGRNVLQHLQRNLVAYLALFVALSSTGYAASSKLLPKNSVGSAQVINGSLQRVDLSKKTIGSLRGRTGRQGPIGTTGLQGAPGAQGAPGPQGPPGVVNAARLTLTFAEADPNAPNILRAFIGTGSTYSECIATANATNVQNASAASDVYCDNTDLNGAHGIYVAVMLGDPMPPDRIFSVTVWQKGAPQYAEPIYCPCG